MIDLNLSEEDLWFSYEVDVPESSGSDLYPPHQADQKYGKHGLG